jgi:uncharacterized oxidoreductase
MKLQNKRVLLTGGSSGIGLALARRLAATGAHLVITGRRSGALESATFQLRGMGATVVPVQGDVADPDARQTFINAAHTKLGGLDILINNAGVVRAGRLDKISHAEVCRMIEVNLTAPILLTQLALPLLKRSGDGLVVNVSSGLGLIGTPFYATYGATKAGLALFSEALRRELKDEGVHVLTIYPTATDTQMMASSRSSVERESADSVADATLKAIQSGVLAVIRGGEARAQMIARNRSDPAALDEHFRDLKPSLEQAVQDHSSL